MKYELTDNTMKYKGRILHCIYALKDFADVKAGAFGGWIESESNLSQDGGAWVYGNAKVYDEALISDNALVSDDAEVYGEARVYGNARIIGDAMVCDKAQICGNACVRGDAYMCGNALVRDDDGLLWVSHIGPKHTTATFFAGADGFIYVHCEGFTGTLDEFTAKVKEEHGNGKFAQEYSAAIELAKAHIVLPK